MFSRCTSAAVACVVIALAGCGSDELGAYSSYRAMQATRRIEVHLPADLDSAELGASARELERRGEWTVVFTREDALDDDAVQIHILGADSPRAARIGAGAGITFDAAKAALTFAGAGYSGTGSGVVATFADPTRSGRSVTVYCAANSAQAAALVTDFAPTWKPAWRTWRDGIIASEGTFAADGTPLPAPSSAALAELARAGATQGHLGAAELVLHGAIDAAALARYRKHLAAARDRVRALFVDGDAPPLRGLRIHVWPDVESLALATGTWALATRGVDGAVHAVVAPELADDGGAEFARAVALAYAGTPAEDWLVEAVGVWAARSWYGVELDEWTDFLFTAHLEPSVANIVEPARRASPHLIAPLRALLLDEALARAGVDTLRRAWRDGGASMWVPNDQLVSRADGDRRATAQVQARKRELRHRTSTAGAFLGGLHLATGSDPTGRGALSFGSREAAEAVRDARAGGANALVLAPQAACVAEARVWPGERRSEPFETATPDASVYAAAAHAHSAGLVVVLAPQLLDSRSGTWSGATMSSSRERWSSFFDELEASSLHYALLGELCNARVLCLAEELDQATKSVYSEEERPWVPSYFYENRARWKTLIEHVRPAFRGALTYAARGPSGNTSEARELEFWSDLDFVAFTVFGALSAPDAPLVVPDDATVIARATANLQALLNFARTLDKPVLLFELGVGAGAANALDLECAPGAVDASEQARLVRCYGEALRRVRAQAWPLAGVFLYSWSIDPRDSASDQRTFSLRDRAAAAALPKLFAGR